MTWSRVRVRMKVRGEGKYLVEEEEGGKEDGGEDGEEAVAQRQHQHRDEQRTAARELLDIIHWALRDHPRRANGSWPIGATLRKQVASRKAPVHSGALAVAKFCAPLVYQTALPFITVDAPELAEPAQTVAGIATVACHPPAVVPVSTSYHDDTQLRWNDREHPCASGRMCAACLLPGAPGPLPFYVPEGVRRCDYEQPAFCLLCIRADVAAVAAVYSRVVQSSERQLGRAAIALPPFQNLVNCDGGYSEQSLGVTPSQAIFAPVAVVGPAIPPVGVMADGTLFVDQSQLKSRSFLGRPAQLH